MTINFKADRINRGLSQHAFAALLGVSVDVVRNLEETGNRPQPANARKIAEFYGRVVTDMWPEPESVTS